MKQYSHKTRKLNELSMKNGSKIYDVDALMSSKEFAEIWEPYIRDIGLSKESKGKKYYRSQEYASIGIMDRNDLIQEAYVSFVETWARIDWKKVDSLPEDQRTPFVWSYIKKSVVRRVHDSVLMLKDGIRVPHRELYYESYKDRKQTRENENIYNITTLFNKLDVIFFRNQEDTALTKWETDILGYFLESKMDDHLDKKADGTRNYMGIERDVISRFFGIDTPSETLKEIGESYEKDASTMRKVKQRALAKLKNDDLKRELSEFCKEYHIHTQADIN